MKLGTQILLTRVCMRVSWRFDSSKPRVWLLCLLCRFWISKPCRLAYVRPRVALRLCAGLHALGESYCGIADGTRSLRNVCRLVAYTGTA